MFAVFATLDVSHSSCWLKLVAPLNIDIILVTPEMSQAERSWLNAEASSNMLSMLVTLDVSQLSGWLNRSAEWNMETMLVTLDVSQPEIPALKLPKL